MLDHGGPEPARVDDGRRAADGDPFAELFVHPAMKGVPVLMETPGVAAEQRTPLRPGRAPLPPSLSHDPLPALQPIEAGLNDPRQGGGHADLHQAAGVEAPYVRLGLDHPLIDQHLDQYFDVKWVSLSTSDHELT